MDRARTLGQRQAKQAAMNDEMKQSQYIVNGYNSPKGKELIHAIVLAYANTQWTNKEEVKSFNKRVASQSKLVSVILESADRMAERFTKEHAHLADMLIGRSTLFNLYLDDQEYNRVFKYLDIYGCILNANIHIMENNRVKDSQCRYVDRNNWTLLARHSSYHRPEAPHLFVMQFKDKYHALSNVDAYMKFTFGHFSFCRKCYETTYANAPGHVKYCNVITTGKQYNRQFQINDVLRVDKEWRPLAWAIELQSYGLGMNLAPENELAERRCLLQECYNAEFIVRVDDTDDCDIDTKVYHILENGDVVNDKELLSLEDQFYQANDDAQSESKSDSDEEYVEDADIEINAFDFADL